MQKDDFITQKQNMAYLSWAKSRNSSGTAGSFLKAYDTNRGIKTYYKLSNYEPGVGITCHECINEIIVCRLLDLLGIHHLSYQLIHADVQINQKLCDTYLCASTDFKEKGDSKIALDDFFDVEHLPDESPLEFCIRQGWGDYIYTMFVVDFLILNRDRHGANIEVLRNSRLHSYRLSPLFDHGLSLLCRCKSDEEAAQFDVTSDRPVNVFIGSRSLYQNLELIPPGKLPELQSLAVSDKEILFSGLHGLLSEVMLDRIWDLIWTRYCYYEDFRNQRQ